MQQKWAIEDGILDENWGIIRTPNLCSPGYWLQQTVSLTQRMRIPLNINFKKKDMNHIFESERVRRLIRYKDQNSTLKYMDDKISEIDLIFNIWQHRWWLLARTGSLFLAQRDYNTDRLCPVCHVSIEDMEHMIMTCTANPTWPPPLGSGIDWTP